ncbi:MAG: hypothetical protein PF508_00080 [Spirochaeta sp.]|nr:hypothetical protein [Spirochaeta sp.]
MCLLVRLHINRGEDSVEFVLYGAVAPDYPSDLFGLPTQESDRLFVLGARTDDLFDFLYGELQVAQRDDDACPLGVCVVVVAVAGERIHPRRYQNTLLVVEAERLHRQFCDQRKLSDRVFLHGSSEDGVREGLRQFDIFPRYSFTHPFLS